MIGIREISRIEKKKIKRKKIKKIVEFFYWERYCDIIKEEILRGGKVYFVKKKRK